jgi:AAA family ATP:ADP antiporter
VSGASGFVAAALRLGVQVRENEIRALLLSFAYFFSLLSSYYVLRPLRDEMGIEAGVEQLQWLFTGTFAAMLLAVPLFGALVARTPKRRFVPLVYRFFLVNLLVFYLAFRFADDPVPVARAFFVWVSVFNLFVVSVFWSFMADLFRAEQGKRLFGFIAAGGTTGGLVGPAVTALLAVPLGPVTLLLVSALLLEVAVRCIYLLLRDPAVQPSGPPPADPERSGPAREEAIGGSIFAGATQVFRSPYLLGICLYILLYTSTSTFLYFEQAHIVADAYQDPAARTQVFALIDLSVGAITLATQLFVTGRLVPWIGVGRAIGFVALLTMLGFVTLSLAPVVSVLVAFQALRRAANFAVSRPAREVLFTVVPPEQKYKCKNFIDTVVYRGGDAASGWAFAGLAGAGLGLSAIALIAVPVAALWLGVGLALGREQERLARPARA